MVNWEREFGGHVGEVAPGVGFTDPGGEEAGLVVKINGTVATPPAPAASDDSRVAVNVDGHLVALRQLPMAVAGGEGSEVCALFSISPLGCTMM